jgi:hypothetical protein
MAGNMAFGLYVDVKLKIDWLISSFFVLKGNITDLSGDLLYLTLDSGYIGLPYYLYLLR